MQYAGLPFTPLSISCKIDSFSGDNKNHDRIKIFITYADTKTFCKNKLLNFLQRGLSKQFIIFRTK